MLHQVHRINMPNEQDHEPTKQQGRKRRWDGLSPYSRGTVAIVGSAYLLALWYACNQGVSLLAKCWPPGDTLGTAEILCIRVLLGIATLASIFRPLRRLWRET